MNTKQIVLAFGTLTLLLAFVFSSCTDDKTETTTGDSGSLSATETTREEYENLTDANGENVTMKKPDETGKEVIYNVLVPKGENTTAPPNAPTNQQQPTVIGQPSDPDASQGAIQALISAFNSKRYHLVCTMKNGDSGTVSEIDMMMYDKDMRVEMDMDGTPLSVGIYDNEFYLMNTAKKSYISLNKSLMKMMGLDMSDLENMNITDAMGSLSGILTSNAKPEVSSVSLNGQAVTLYSYKGDNGDTERFYLNGNNLVKIEKVDQSGKSKVNMDIKKFNANVQQSEVKPIANYQEKNIFQFASDMGISMS